MLAAGASPFGSRKPARSIFDNPDKAKIDRATLDGIKLQIQTAIRPLLDAAGGLVAEKVFRADGSAAGTLQVSLDAPAPFVAVELLAGAYDGGSFVHGAYANADGSFGSTAFVGVDGAWHGSDFMVDWIEFDVPL